MLFKGTQTSFGIGQTV